jgi:hypothetical protein
MTLIPLSDGDEGLRIGTSGRQRRRSLLFKEAF